MLDQYYIPTRYANAFASGAAKRYFTEFQAKQAIEFAESILNEVKKIVFKGKT
ncbi:MAG: HEPN domain-containing protein [Candidatus Bathyarchaeia archaeon]